MKNQYFGDINDYKKYSLLRHLNGHGKITTTVCWMLTQNDLRPDGHRIEYLLEPDKWRRFDPDVYDHLREQVIEHQNRKVSSIESSAILPNCRFYSDIIQDRSASRKEYLQRFLEFSRDAALVFFDPDNGIEVKSIPFGRKNSSKYLYWTETEESYSAGHSVLVYQHLPPKPREQFIRNLVDRFGELAGVNRVYLYLTQFSVFFLIPQAAQEVFFEQMSNKVTEVWGREIEFKQYIVSYKVDAQFRKVDLYPAQI